MNKREFLDRLEAGLAGLAPEERVAAMQYYIEYLDDAGPERQEEVLAELGSPESIAAGIRAESRADGWTPPEKKTGGAPQATQPATQGVQGAPQSGSAPAPAEAPLPPPHYRGEGTVVPPSAPQPPPYEAPYQAPYNSGAGNTAAAAPQPQNVGRNVLLIVLAIFLFPVIISLLATLVPLFISAVVILAVPLIVGFSLAVAGLAVIVFGCFGMSIFVPTGLATAGAGLVITGLGLLCGYGGILLFTKLVPAVVRGTKWAARKLTTIFRRQEG